MNIEQYHLKQLLKELEKETGIRTSQANRWQVEQRIQSLCTKQSLSSFHELRLRLHTPSRHSLLAKLIECIVVQESYFFRDMNFFTQLEQELLPTLQNKSQPIRIWSAACAQGQEIYSIAMLCHKLSILPNIELYASDISELALEAAQDGVYPYTALQRSLSKEQIQSFFSPKYKQWQLKESIRKDVHFFPHNLIYPCGKRRFYHIIILKNVLMYFAPKQRDIIIQYAKNALTTDGYLIISNPATQILRCTEP
jgi:chemotaxis protein methyltransferase CheR